MKKNKFKRVLSIVLATVMVAGTIAFIPQGTSEVQAATATVKNINLGTGGFSAPTSTGSNATTWEGSKVYYGNKLWRVLDPNHDSNGTGGSAFLFSEELQGSKAYNNTDIDVTWETCTLRNYLNGTNNSGGTGTFLGDTFTTNEQSAINTTIVQNSDNSDYGTLGGASTQDKIFLLSLEEVRNADYGFGSNATRAVAASPLWWLRSPGFIYNFVVTVYPDGEAYSYGYNVDSTYGTVRPAFNLNLDFVLFTSAVADGKSSGTVGADALNSVSEYPSDTAKEWKVTLLDTSRNNFTAGVNSASSNTVKAGGCISIDYSNAKTEANEYVSAMLCDKSDNVLYYGNIAKSSANGTQTVNIPINLADGDYELRIFSEQLNEDKKTDYASNFATIDLTVNGVQLSKPAAAFTARSENGGTLTNIESGMSYSVDGGNNWNALTGTTATITGVTAEKNIQVKRIGDGTSTFDSDIQTIEVTQASAPTGLSGTDCTTSANNDGKISGVNSTMEYKLSSASDWKAVEKTELTGLSNETYQVRVKASGTVLASEAQSITIGAYVAPPAPSVPTVANYTDVDKAIKEIPADLSLYTDASVNALNHAVAAVDRNKTQAEQTIVDGYAAAIRDAIKALKYKDADYSKVDTAIGKIPADLSIYTDASVKALNDAKKAVVRGKNITEQSTVDGYATAIQKAIDGLVKKTGTVGNNNNNNNNTNDTNKDKNATSPQTGDSSNMLLWIAVLMISAGGILTIRITQKTYKKHSES